MVMRFLRRFLTGFGGPSPAAKSSARAGAPPPEAVVSNYLTSHSYIRGNRVHSSAFLPRNGELSVFQTQGLEEPEIWQLGVEHVLKPGRRLHGRADNSPGHYYANALRLVADDVPPRHVNAIGWPDDAEKDAQKEIALALAAAAQLRRCDPPIRRP